MANIKWNENIKMYRERSGLSQKELSMSLGISERTLQRYEAGDSEPTISILLKLSKIYDTSIDNIIGNDVSNNFDITKIERYIRAIENSCNTLRREMYENEKAYVK